MRMLTNTMPIESSREDSRGTLERWVSLASGCSPHHAHAVPVLQHYTPTAWFPQHQVRTEAFPAPDTHDASMATPEPRTSSLPCHLSGTTWSMAFLLTPRGKQRSASVTPPCEQPPLYSFGGIVVSSERQHLPVDSFPCHPRAEFWHVPPVAALPPPHPVRQG